MRGTSELTFVRTATAHVQNVRQQRCTLLCSILPLLFVAGAAAAEPAPPIGERPAIENHLEQADIDAGAYSIDDLFTLGGRLFEARFNRLDGQGRPGSTGGGAPRVADQPAFIRTSGPDSNACSGCHAQPSLGGSGDFVANVFVLAQVLDPVTESVSGDFSNERNTLGMHGSGAIEMLAREMSDDLIAIRDGARAAALARVDAGEPPLSVMESRALVTKGVSFGAVTVRGDGRVAPGAIEGVDWDLILKPFHQKGAVVSLREFTNNAMNHHHGMQTVERFGAGVDPDADGHFDELSIGDVTATTIFQAALPAPRQVLPEHELVRAAVARGRALFDATACGSCHVAELTLNDATFTEPNPYNPAGNLKPEDVPAPFPFDLIKVTGLRRAKGAKGATSAAIVSAFTDLKRHDLNDVDIDHFANEQLSQGTLYGFAAPADFYNAPADPRRPTRQFLTRKLWDAGSSMPYGHRGDLTTLTEAIEQHGGEARAARDAFLALAAADRAALIEFLKSLQVVAGG